MLTIWGICVHEPAPNIPEGAATSLPLFVLEEMMDCCLSPASNSGDLGPMILRLETEA